MLASIADTFIMTTISDKQQQRIKNEKDFKYMNKIPFEYGSIAENPFYRFGQMMTLKKIAKEY